MKTRDSLRILDKAREMCAPPTWYALAKRLHVQNSTLTRCRLHGGTLDNEASYRLAELLGQEPMDVIRIMEYERARDPEKRAFWEKQLPRVLPVVAYLGIITGTVTQLTPAGTEVVEQAIHYAQWLYISAVLWLLASVRRASRSSASADQIRLQG